MTFSNIVSGGRYLDGNVTSPISCGQCLVFISAGSGNGSPYISAVHPNAQNLLTSSNFSPGGYNVWKNAYYMLDSLSEGDVIANGGNLCVIYTIVY